jgi:hypothetical protein
MEQQQPVNWDWPMRHERALAFSNAPSKKRRLRRVARIGFRNRIKVIPRGPNTPLLTPSASHLKKMPKKQGLSSWSGKPRKVRKKARKNRMCQVREQGVTQRCDSHKIHCLNALHTSRRCLVPN